MARGRANLCILFCAWPTADWRGFVEYCGLGGLGLGRYTHIIWLLNIAVAGFILKNKGM